MPTIWPWGGFGWLCAARYPRQPIIENADIPSEVLCPRAGIPAEAGSSSRNKEGRERSNYEGRGLKSQNRRPKLVLDCINNRYMGRRVRARGLHRSEERRVGKECRSRWS